MRKLLIALGGALMMALTLTPAAHAAAGDQTVIHNENEAWLKTNQCNGGYGANGYFVPRGGAPGQPSELIALATAAGSSKCQSRIRMLYVPTWNAKPVMTGYVYRTNTNQPAGVVRSGIRCYVEFGVRRNDGTFFTRFLINPNRPPHCPY